MHTAAAHNQDKAGRRRETQRSCIVTRRQLPPQALIRFVMAPDGSVVPDLKNKLPGRGAWVSGDAQSVATAVKKQLFSRAFKRQARAEADLCQRVEALLAENALGSLGLARKAGKVVTGFAKVEHALRSGTAEVLIHASDGAEDGKRKLGAALKASGRSGEVAAIGEFTSRELSLALGTANVIHAALLGSGVGKAFAERAERLRRFRHGKETIADGGACERSVENVGVA